MSVNNNVALYFFFLQSWLLVRRSDVSKAGSRTTDLKHWNKYSGKSLKYEIWDNLTITNLYYATIYGMKLSWMIHSKSWKIPHCNSKCYMSHKPLIRHHQLWDCDHPPLTKTDSSVNNGSINVDVKQQGSPWNCQ